MFDTTDVQAALIWNDRMSILVASNPGAPRKHTTCRTDQPESQPDALSGTSTRRSSTRLRVVTRAAA
ncbi:hypothetical protein [Chenggangzhangella methanolivorans]|uniref:Uncharacterized protein n=1 Tax=Chenggangzhangella methanolivorans TaxID=1437009 RepID=A0A9E6RIN8_9HYPH|nr:hypothetical protein [Chenggangzhangella methanolivorans]QZO01702.1 hypothetical protein K6K41_10150 [Chenggangzhangella methanolivorans]